MILNAYAVLAIFVGLVEIGLGIAVVWLAGSALRRRRAALLATGPSEAVEARAALLWLLAFALVVASVASWPILYLLLSSYVPQWAGVMCIQGVARVGTGSEGPAGWLPTLVRALEISKPALVFATGASMVLHLANRRTRTSPLAGRALGALLVVGLLATLDAGAQLAYVAIPKKEQFLAAGCCLVPRDVAEGAASIGLAVADDDLGGPARSALSIAFYALTGALVIGTRWAASTDGSTPPGVTARIRPRWTSDALGVVALASLPVAVRFLADVAAPALLGRPGHRCAHCLLTSSPIGVAAIAAYLVGAFATGWAAVADRCARNAETAAFLPAQRRKLLDLGCLGYGMALVLVTGGVLAA